MFENFCSDIIQTMKYFALESFNLNCQAEHNKINSRLNFYPGLALIAFSTTRSWLRTGNLFVHMFSQSLSFTNYRFFLTLRYVCRCSFDSRVLYRRCKTSCGLSWSSRKHPPTLCCAWEARDADGRTLTLGSQCTLSGPSGKRCGTTTLVRWMRNLKCIK